MESGTFDYEKFEAEFFAKTGKIESAIDRHIELFDGLWHASASEDEWYELADTIYQELYDVHMPRNHFDTGWQYRTVLTEDYDEAKSEFLNLIAGFW